MKPRRKSARACAQWRKTRSARVWRIITGRLPRQHLPSKK
jgi:hypothetical protein